MSWITLTESDVQTRLTGPELAAMKGAALATGQTSPLSEVIGQVTELVRGYCLGNARNTLGPLGTIPARLEAAALNLIRLELATRLPVASLATDDRKKAADEAMRQLRDVAAGTFQIDVPAVASSEPGASARPSFVRVDRQHSVAQQDGL